MTSLTIKKAQFLVNQLGISNIITVCKAEINKQRSAILINNSKLEIRHTVFIVDRTSQHVALSRDMKGFVKAYLGDVFLIKTQISRVVVEMFKNTATKSFPMSQLNYKGVRKDKYLVMECHSVYYVVDLTNGNLGLAPSRKCKVKSVVSKKIDRCLLIHLRSELLKLGVVLENLASLKHKS